MADIIVDSFKQLEKEIIKVAMKQEQTKIANEMKMAETIAKGVIVQYGYGNYVPSQYHRTFQWRNSPTFGGVEFVDDNTIKAEIDFLGSWTGEEGEVDVPYLMSEGWKDRGTRKLGKWRYNHYEGSRYLEIIVSMFKAKYPHLNIVVEYAGQVLYRS